MNKSPFKFFVVLNVVFFTLISPRLAWAQDTGADEDIEGAVDAISNVLEKNIPSSDEVIEDDEEAVSNTIKKGNATDRANYNQIRSNEFQANLGVVQKNFLTKTGRVELHGAFALVPSEVFYRTFGGQLNFGYHFNETYAINGLGYFFTSSARGEISDLEKINRVDVESLIYLKSYYALALYVNTIYGKMTYFNQNITPFEIFFTGGLGRIRTQASEESLGLHLGVGNTFYLSKNSGVRLDLNWVFYQTKDINDRNQNANSIILSLGYSGFYPESRDR